MSSKRKPLHRLSALQITPLAIRLFTEMEAISCTCAPRDSDGKYWKHEQCAGCKRWWELHGRLHDELRCRGRMSLPARLRRGSELATEREGAAHVADAGAGRTRGATLKASRG